MTDLVTSVSQGDKNDSASPPSQLSSKQPSTKDPKDPETPSWYAVVVGRTPGVVEGSLTIEANVKQIPGAHVARFSTKEAAIDYFNGALNLGQVVRVTYIEDRQTLNASSTGIPGLPDNPGMDVDGDRYYAIYIGRSPGIFNGKGDPFLNTMGIPRSRCEKFATYLKAVEVFMNTLNAGQVERVVHRIRRVTLSSADFP
ncbi:hypothetical protein GALMADRAFT_141646 [Galerina marginata CBS 339.88]|uniref:Ribonuclease H1 N-terminal domain-containing protein n=1 Tax=Galerina marginata (strain CBS 339.88) TaxID=685588 RepID=A0A067T1R0_GALM3|nr:hypothetical protein GALMADRAFT_141646 [Galerina marginata CBS 339.88]